MSTESVFINYSDYYAYAADMHRQVWTSLSDLDTQILQLDELIQNDPQGFVQELAIAISSVRQNLMVNFSQISYLEDSFVELFKYVYKKTSLGVDDYLTQQNIKVFYSYAQVSNSLASPISASNIKEE